MSTWLNPSFFFCGVCTLLGVSNLEHLCYSYRPTQLFFLQITYIEFDLINLQKVLIKKEKNYFTKLRKYTILSFLVTWLIAPPVCKEPPFSDARAIFPISLLFLNFSSVLQCFNNRAHQSGNINLAILFSLRQSQNVLESNFEALSLKFT